MSTNIFVMVEDITQRLADGYTIIELERATTAGGSYSQIATKTLVALTYNYTIADSTGELNKWYRYRFSDAAAFVSEYSNPFQPDGLTLKKIRQNVLNEYGVGLVFNATAGSTTTVTTTDPKVKSSIFSSTRGKGTWLLPTSGAEIGNYRMISSPNPTTGVLTVEPAWGTGPGSGDEFEWHFNTSPDELDRAINRGLARYWFVDTIPIPGVADQREYSLSAYPWLTQRRQVLDLHYYPSTTVNRTPWGVGGRWWNTMRDRDQLKLLIEPPIATTVILYLVTARHMDKLHTDTASPPPNCNLDMISAFAYDELLAYLSRPGVSPERAMFLEARTVLNSETLPRLVRENRPEFPIGIPQPYMPPVVPQTRVL
jgi:hypothetical protein